jgi:hypothetical protein
VGFWNPETIALDKEVGRSSGNSAYVLLKNRTTAKGKLRNIQLVVVVTARGWHIERVAQHF